MLNASVGVQLIFAVVFVLLSACQKTSDTKTSDEASPVAVDKPKTQGSPESELLPNTPPNSPSSLPQVSELKLAQESCAESVCGKESVFIHPHELSNSTKVEDLALIQKKLKRPLQLYMGQIIHRNLLMDRGYKEIFKDIKKDAKALSLSENAKALLKGVKLLKTINKYLPALEWTATGVTLNADKMRKIESNLSDLEIEAYQKLTIVFLPKWYSAGQNDDRYFKSLFPAGPTPAEAMRLEAEVLELMAQKIEQEAPEAVIMYFDGVFMRVKNSQHLSNAETSHFRMQSEWIRMIFKLINADMLSVFAKLDYNLDLEAQNAVAEYNKSTRGVVFKDKTKIKAQLVDATNSCMNYMNYAYGALPQKVMLDQFRIGIDEIKETGFSMSAKRGVSATLLADVDNKLKIKLPQDKDSAILDWKETFDIEKKSQALGRKFIEQLGLNSKMTGDEKDLALTDSAKARLLFQLLMNDPSSEFFSEPMAICQKAVPQYLNDYASPFERYVELSWPTIAAPKVGFSIFTHEFGHVLAVSIADFAKDAKACLKAMHGTDLYIEEDFADLFASEIALEKQQSINGQSLNNMGCELMGLKNGLWDVGEGVKNSRVGDPHSSGFYRLIAIATVTNKMTPQCKKALEMGNEVRFNSYCRW